MNQAARRIRLITLLPSLSVLFVACGGDDENAVAVAAPGGNQAPAISGAPPTSVLQGTTYSFTPNVSHREGNTLTFSVINLPGWATFDPSTGRVSGTPAASHVGTYSNIMISVSDGSANANLVPFNVQVVATATGSALLTWSPPTQNTDGSALTNLAAYKVYWGRSQGNYTNSVTLDNPGLSSYVVDQLTPATWHFALTAVNSAGIESVFSSPVSKSLR